MDIRFRLFLGRARLDGSLLLGLTLYAYRKVSWYMSTVQFEAVMIKKLYFCSASPKADLLAAAS